MFKSKIRICFVLLIICLIFLSKDGYAMTSSKNNSPKIISIKNVSATVKQFVKYNLPTKIKADFNNDKTGMCSVKWNTSKVKTDKAGTYNYYGVVTGYTKYVKLTLNVVPFITSVNNIDETIKTNQEFMLPDTVKVNYSDNVKRDVDVNWDKESINTSISGTFIIHGKINNYNKEVVFILKIINSISRIDNINVTVKNINEYNLPDTIKAVLKDGTISDVYIKWYLDPENIGGSDYIGIVEGYEKDVKLKIDVVPVITSIPDKNIIVHLGEKYELPKTVEAEMSDGTNNSFPIAWNQASIDITKIGQYKVIGKVVEYGKDINYLINVKSGVVCTQPYAYLPKWGYIAISYCKDIAVCTDMSKIEIRSEDGVISHPYKIENSYNDKKTLLIFTSMYFDPVKKYTLFIPKGIIKAVDGDISDEDITLELNSK